MASANKVVVNFLRVFTKGVLAGIVQIDRITFPTVIDAQTWVRGVESNSKRGVLDYRLEKYTIVD